MAYAESRIGKVLVKQQGAWGTAATSLTADNLMEVEMSYPTLVTEAISTEAMKGNYHNDTVLAGSEQGTTFELRFPLHGWDTSGTTIGEDPDVANNPEVLLLQSALGGLIVQGYSAGVAAGSTTTVVNYTDGDAGTGWQGSAQLYDIGSGNFGAGWVKSVDAGASPDTVTLIRALSAAPAAGKAYGSATAYLDTGTPLPLTVQYMGANEGGNGVGCQLVDCVVTSFKLTVNPREQVMCDVSLIAGSWSTLTSDVTDQYAYSYNQLGVLMSENGARMVSAAGEVEAFSSEITIENTVVPVGKVGGAQGIAQFASTLRAVTMSMTVPATSAGFATNLLAPGANMGTMQMDLCQAAGKSMSILIPAGVMTEQTTVGDQDGLIALTRTIGCAKYTADQASTNAGNKAFRIALM